MSRFQPGSLDLVPYSVVITAHNVAPWIGAAIESCLAQTQPPGEIIVVEDGSEDATRDEIDSISRRHPGSINVISQPKLGAQAARNVGLQAARFEWIQHLDGDDELLPGKVERQLRMVVENDAAVVAGAFVRGKQKEEALDSRPITPGGSGDPWTRLFRSGCGITSANLFRKSALLSVGGWNERQRRSQEYELMFRILQHGGRIVPDEEVGAFIRRREDSLSGGFDCRARIISAELRLEILSFLQGSGQLSRRRRRAMGSGYVSQLRALSRCDADVAGRLFKKLYRPMDRPSTLQDSVFEIPARVLGISRTERLFRTLKSVVRA